MSDLCQYPGGCFQPLPCPDHSPRDEPIKGMLQRATERAVGSPAEGQALRAHGVGPVRSTRLTQRPGPLFEDDQWTNAIEVIRAWANGATVNVARFRDALSFVLERTEP